jgi:tRNA threonylcarbamoyladenosine biosynthesis protein TsaB
VLALAVESATETAAVCLADENGVLGSIVVARGRRHTEAIAPAIATLSRLTGVALGDLDVLGVDVGPGLFTGLRVGVATVKALSFALDVPVVTATSLEILAHAMAGSGPNAGRLLVPVVDARRGGVFSARFRPAPGTGTGAGTVADLTTAVAEAVWTPEALAADLAVRSEPFVLAGDGALRYSALFDAVPGVRQEGPAYAAPPVDVLAGLTVARGLAGDVHDGAQVMPRYLRDADARINWEQRVAPRTATTAGG